MPRDPRNRRRQRRKEAQRRAQSFKAAKVAQERGARENWREEHEAWLESLWPRCEHGHRNPACDRHRGHRSRHAP